MPYFNSINSYQNKPKIKLFLQKRKNQIFRVMGAHLLTPKASGGWGRSFQTPETAPHPVQISGYVPGTIRMLLILPIFTILQ